MPEVQRSVDTQSVLVVEDDPVVRLLACEALSEIGFAAVEAETRP